MDEMSKQQHLDMAAAAQDRMISARDGEEIEKAAADFAFHMHQAELAEVAA